MQIIRNDGNVSFADNSGVVFKIVPTNSVIDVIDDKFLQLKFGSELFRLNAEEVTATQTLGGILNPFTGNAYDLILILKDIFFFELGGGGGSQDLANVLTNGNSTGFQDIDMSFGDLKNINTSDYNESINVIPTTAQLNFSNIYHTFVAGLGGNNIKLKIGTQEFVRVVNKTTPLIDLVATNYQAVVVSGATGQRLSVRLAQADSDANSAGTIGLVAEKIDGNQEGFICTVGTLENLNTTGSLFGETWSDGDILFLSPTTPGAITNVKPVAPQHLVVLGYVEYAHINKGKIYVKVDNGYELSELHDVAYPTTPQKGEYLEYETNRWVNKGIVYTVELIDALTVDFYAPYALKINTINNVLNSPTTTILDDGAAYTLTNTIAVGSKITVTVNTAAVINLNITKA